MSIFHRPQTTDAKPRRTVHASRRFPRIKYARKYTRLMEPGLRTYARELVRQADKAGLLDWYDSYLKRMYQGKRVNKIDRDVKRDLEILKREAKRRGLLASLLAPIAGVLEGLVHEVWGDASELAFAKMGVQARWNLQSPAVEQAIADNANKITGVTETQFDLVMTTIRDQFYAKGASPVDVNFLTTLQETAGKSTQYEAERIARTEVNKIQSQAAYTTYKANGVEGKQWLWSGSGYPRHEGLANQIVPIDEPFANGVMYPGDGPPEESINCGCDMAPVISNALTDELRAQGVVTG